MVSRTNEQTRMEDEEGATPILRIDIWDSDFQLSVQQESRASLLFIHTWPPDHEMLSFSVHATMLRQKYQSSNQNFFRPFADFPSNCDDQNFYVIINFRNNNFLHVYNTRFSIEISSFRVLSLTVFHFYY